MTVYHHNVNHISMDEEEIEDSHVIRLSTRTDRGERLELIMFSSREMLRNLCERTLEKLNGTAH